MILGGLKHGGVYTWRGLFSEFYGTSKCEDGYIFVKRGQLMYVISLLRGEERCVMTLLKTAVRKNNWKEKHCSIIRHIC